MSTKTITSVLFVLIILAIGVNFLVTDAPAELPKFPTGPATSTANPASIFCADNGGALTFHSTDEGVVGTCSFKTGEQCEEWALYRGECDIEGVSKRVSYSNGTDVVRAIYRAKDNTVIVSAPHIYIENLLVKPAVSASGARYESADKRTEFWEHQEELTITVDGENKFTGKLTK